MCSAPRRGMVSHVTKADERRKKQIIDILGEAFAPLMKADPAAFRVKYRKMAVDPFAFYRGTACLFYADITPRGGPVGRRAQRRRSGSTATCTPRTSAPT